ncbi:(3R)-3-hydroxyacyl-CoA dehydrogenase / 3a,7a,12a-trihydroxy-5b-cholest-24-enoyl-CoA hydratase / enoyl-CoA hydratase 2 [Entomortierella parvispora]|uniref:(3R)-3-hydroxyacyl-CoA dehydrogenase / 3a,7a,12a-trihydroxy-5b-cholest-24-enoyl-CoA hydratase / enoyl-CoA hydratase 2 n=1 Tax=Entomortierella parvispora TaxID=205924 RepID=A0A9P3LZY9_9FUNG|nr:(3R)-3-hydroxyacyl-CoA dehydrogenase / 3a,7a,12a-trihydroxy-5b-cholest-24-enoyl-CoA hydratase / enoyl-CoA hydratase 2 [Entomortierella parvispora]
MAQNLRFDGRVVIVTGAGGGLGRSHALAFGARGASVVVNDLGGSFTGEGASTRAADVVVEEIRAAGGKAVPNYDSVLDGDKIVETAMKAYGRVDIIINNAGILKDVSFARMTDQQWDIIFQVHVHGAYKVTKAAWPIFKKQKFGRIINTTSAAGLYGNFGQANYSAAKLALVGFTQTLALEGKKDNIYTNVIAPMAASRMTETVLPPDMLASLKPEMVTPLVEYLCHEDSTENGSIFEVGAGYVGKLRWERTGGHGFPIDRTLLPEHIQERWEKITNFEDGRATHPTSTQESMEGIIANFENVAGEAAAAGRPRVVSEDGKVDVEAAKSLTFESDTFEYSERDVILYNLGLGATRKDLHLVYENSENFTAVPTFGVIPSFTAMNAVPFGDILPSFNPMMLLHGEQYLEIIKPFPSHGKLISTPYVVDILDKGKGCVATIGVKTTDENGEDICINEFTMFIRGAGNFGGKKEGADRGASTASNQAPSRKPDHIVQEKTHENQAALYRLSGDWNPLHIDPEMAAVGGFDVPILHGLCSFGIAGKHIFNTYCNNDANNFKNIKVRFAKTVNPGETLETSMWREGSKVIFQVHAVERDVIVISNAAVELQGEALKAAPAAPVATSPPAAGGAFKSDAVFEQIKTGIEAMSAAERQAQVKKVKGIFQFEITNEAGQTATYHVDLKNGEGVVGSGPAAAKPDVVISVKDDIFVDLASGKANAQKLFMSGGIKVKGQVMLATKLGDILKANKSKL